MIARLLPAALAVALAALVPAQTVPEPSEPLLVGDPAPAMKVERWIRGDAYSTFKPGQVYVVEFWATWCGPCRTSIPHLSKLQKRYGPKVNFTGVAVSQSEPKDRYVQVVADYVKGMGAKMEYGVAVDTLPTGGAMSNAWMSAARQNGIPTAFVVDKGGKVAWIGHPMDADLPKTLDAVLDGSYDMAAARKAAQERLETERAMPLAFEAAGAAYGRGDDAQAERVLVEFAKRYPLAAGAALGIRFSRHLEKGREQAAHDLLRAEWPETELSVDDLNSFAWDLLTNEAIKRRDYPLAIAMARKGVELSEEKDAAMIDTLARAYFDSGDSTNAVRWQERAVRLTDGEDKEMVAALARYRKAKR